MKNRLYQKFLRDREPATFSIFKSYRNELNSCLRKAKKNYCFNLFEGTTDSSKVWRQLNELLHRKKSNRMDTLVIDGITYSGNELADKVNSYFSTLIDSSHDSSALQYLNEHLGDSIFLSHCDEAEVLSVYRDIKNSNRDDAFNLKIKPIMYVLDILCPILTHIHNL